jgi:serine/threonine protein kinase
MSLDEFKAEIIGKGSYGEVSLLTNRSGDKFISKKMKNTDTSISMDTIKEIFILSNIHHPNIVSAELINSGNFFKIYDNFTEVFLEYMDGDLYKLFSDNVLYKYLKIPDIIINKKIFNSNERGPVYEFSDAESSFNYLSRSEANEYYFTSKDSKNSQFNLPKELQKYLDWDILFNIMKQILDGLICLHNNGVIHSDLKLQNILYKITESEHGLENIEIKLTDFGISEILIYPKHHKSCHCTPHFCPPECNISDLGITDDIGISYKMDSYSVGSCFYLMLMSYLKGNTLYNDCKFWMPEIEKTTKELMYKSDGDNISKINEAVNSILTNNGKCENDDLFSEDVREQVSVIESLIRNLIQFNIEDRITCMEARNIPLFEPVYLSTMKGGAVLTAKDKDFLETRYYNLSKEIWLTNDFYKATQFNTLIEREYHCIIDNLKKNQLYNNYISSTSVLGDTKFQIKFEMISITMDWIMEVANKLKPMSVNTDEILAQTLLILQFYINIKGPNSMPRSKLQAYGIVAYSIAFQIYTGELLDTEGLSDITAKAYTIIELSEIKKDILNTLGCLPVIPNYYWTFYYYSEFFYDYLNVDRLDMDLYYTEIKILSTNYLLNMKLFRYPKYIIGFIVILIVLQKHLRKRELLTMFISDKMSNLNKYMIPGTDFDTLISLMIETEMNFYNNKYKSFQGVYKDVSEELKWINIQIKKSNSL